MKIPVFYTRKMVADSQSASPSAAKPEKVVASWQAQFDIEVIEPTPVTTDELKRAHDADFVDGVMSLTIDNGFGNRSAYVAAALPYTSGAMLSAARHVLQTKKVAVAPVSGFHHAGTYSAEGYCTFNGLMVTTLALKEEGLVQTVGILDFDMHYGNGTEEIIQTKNASFVRHFTAGLYFDHPSQTKQFFDVLPQILAQFAGCDVLLYQAGADPHINDPHGGWLTTEEMRIRDAKVFEAMNAMGVPIVWDLAGGYQVESDGSIPKVLEIHDNTMRECVRVFGE